jgi:hypothetical protein
MLMRRGVGDLATGGCAWWRLRRAMLKADEAANGSLARLLRAHVTEEWPPENWEPHVSS